MKCRLFGHKYGHANTIETDAGEISHAECERTGCDYVRKRIIPTFDVDEDTEITPEFLASLEREFVEKARKIARENPRITVKYNGTIL